MVDILNYFRETWLPVINDLAEYAHKGHRTFGIVATSRTESAHGGLKRFFSKRSPDFAAMWQAILAHMRRQRAKYFTALQTEAEGMKNKWLQLPLTNKLYQLVGHWAMKKIWGQYELAKIALEKAREAHKKQLSPPNYPGSCTRQFTAQFGLPCTHRIYNMLIHKHQLQLKDLDVQWWMKRKEVCPDNSIIVLAIQFTDTFRLSPGPDPRTNP